MKRLAGAALPLAALAAAALAAAASPAAGQVRRVEVVGTAAPAGEAEGPGALEAAFAEAVTQVAHALLGEAGAPPDEALAAQVAAALGSDARAYVVRYQVLAEGVPAPGGSEAGTGLRAAVFVDADRVAARLRAAGLPVPEPDAAPQESFALIVLEPPSYAALGRLRAHLLASTGARRVVPERFEAGRAVLRVEAPGGADAVLARLRADPPQGLRVEMGAPSAEGAAVWLVELPGSAPEPAAEPSLD